MSRNILAIIPARGGSQRVPNKNIRALAGKPLLAYTIASAQASKLVTRTIVSTDSPEIARAAQDYGAEVPFLRPAELSNSQSTELEYHVHALQWLKENENYVPDLIVNLYPTTPFRRAETIDAAIEKILAHPEAESLRSMRKCSEHPYKMWTVDGEWAKPFVDATDSQSHTAAYHLLPKVFIQNASIYITKPEALTRYGSTIGKKVLAFEMTEEESIDINSPLDFQFAELLAADPSLRGSR